MSTKKKELDEAAIVACDFCDEMKSRVKSNMAILTKKFSSVANAAIKDMQGQLDAGYGKKTFLHYIGYGRDTNHR